MPVPEAVKVTVWSADSRKGFRVVAGDGATSRATSHVYATEPLVRTFSAWQEVRVVGVLKGMWTLQPSVVYLRDNAIVYIFPAIDAHEQQQ